LRLTVFYQRKRQTCASYCSAPLLRESLPHGLSTVRILPTPKIAYPTQGRKWASFLNKA
jgi:hypothetical protein